MLNLCYKEKILEKYVLGKGLSESEIEEIKMHIKTCKACQDYIDELSEFYQAADQVPGQTLDRIEQGVSRNINQKSYVFTMHPMNIERNTQKIFKLAADSERIIQRYETIQTFSCDSDELLARLVQDHESNTLTLFVIPGNENSSLDYCLVFQDNDDVRLTDSKGRIDLSDFLVDEIVKRKFILKSPVASFDLHPFHYIEEEVLQKGVYAIEGSPDQILLEIQPEKTAKTYRLNLKFSPGTKSQQMEMLITREDKLPEKVTLSGASVSLQKDDVQKILSVKIYEAS